MVTNKIINKQIQNNKIPEIDHQNTRQDIKITYHQTLQFDRSVKNLYINSTGLTQRWSLKLHKSDLSIELA